MKKISSENLSCKAVNFDLNVNNLKLYYDKGDYHNAYRDLKNFFEKNGFEHRQGSGYISIKPIKIDKVTLLCRDLTVQFPWISNCVNRFDVTEIGDTFDMTEYLLEPKSKELRKISLISEYNDEVTENLSNYYYR